MAMAPLPPPLEPPLGEIKVIAPPPRIPSYPTGPEPHTQHALSRAQTDRTSFILGRATALAS